MKRSAALLAVLALLISSLAPAASLGAPPEERGPSRVTSKADGAKTKIHPRLRAQIDAGKTGSIFVFATVAGDPAQARAMLANDHVARLGNGAASIVVGRIEIQQLAKLASLKGVASVQPVELKQTAQPLGQPDPDLDRNISNAALKGAFKQLLGNEVPYSEAPPPAGSNFEQLRELALLDAKTHNFVEAWDAGYTGEGSTVSVLDGGTDWGHPDMLGTWHVGPDGWPLAMDPYGTLVLLVAEDLVEQGLTWYTPTEAKDDFTASVQDGKKGIARVSFDTRLGPSRNFQAPDAKVTHTYAFQRSWSKSGTVRMGNHPDDYLLGIFGERPAFIVVDPNTAGVYDTVYVDLDNDHSFIDEKPVTKASPASYRDMNGDGLTDVSGGLLYHLSDGATPLGGGPDLFGDFVFGPGEMLAWTGDFDPAIGGHGTLTASNVVGQGVINGLAPTFADVPGGTPPGMVIGGAPHAKLAPMGDIYFSFEFSTQLGYVLTQLYGIDITSNSYGDTSLDNDGFDAFSQEADFWNTLFGVRTLMVGSTGNGAPGYGTTNAPSPYTGMSVGASTQFGGTGWDSIVNHSQIRDNDVIGWSDRGPGATGANGVDLVADGAYSAGDATLNSVLNGDLAWTTWGGTSRSTPVVAGAAALVYEAWRDANGGADVPDGFAIEAREILKAGADDLGYDSFTQGAGSLDAGRAVAIAASNAQGISPSEWRPGDYRGEEYEVFPRTLAAGEGDTQTFALGASGTYGLSDRVLSKVHSESIDFTSSPISAESTAHFNVPDYLIDITDLVESHAGADLITIRAIYPDEQFDVDGDYSYDQRWRLLAYDWTDVNGDGNLWTDKDGDGAVDSASYNRSSNIDGNPDIKWHSTEIDRGEYVRFTYNGPGGNALHIHVADPAERSTDGIFIGLQHPEKTPDVPVTSIDIQVDVYDNVDWDWLTVPASAEGSFEASVSVPQGTPAGLYEGAIVASKDGHDTAIPVVVNVAVEAAQDEAGKLTGSLTFGGADVAAAQDHLPYNNGAVFGSHDWNWRPESGDWRFFYLDVAQEPAPGSLLLVNTTWEDEAPTDLDTLVFGRSENHYQVVPAFGFPEVAMGAPYILDTVGGSPNANIGGGVWAFNTATGGPEDLVAAPVQEGLHAVVHHAVNWSGNEFYVPFETTVGSATVDPAAVEVTATGDTGSFDVTFEASLDLDGLAADAFGLSQPIVTTETAQQDDPADPSSASVKRQITIDHAARLSVSTALSQDIDLFVVFDADGDGAFEDTEIVASSATGAGDEAIEIVAPADGEYEVWVQGFAIAGTPTFPLTIDALQGSDMTVSGLPAGELPAGTPVTIHVEFDKAMTVGETYFGELQLGPPAAPNALSVPISVTRE